MWTVVLALPHPAPHWVLVLLIVVISVGGPGSMVGFDFARTFNPRATPGHRTGRGQHGRILASLLVMQAMGLIIGAAGGYSFSLVPAGLVRAVRGVGGGRGRHPDHPPQGARRTIGDIEESRYLLEFFTDAELQSAGPRPVASGCGWSPAGWPS